MTIPTENSTKQSDNIKRPTEFNYTTIADQLRMVSYRAHSHQTDVINLVYRPNHPTLRNSCVMKGTHITYNLTYPVFFLHGKSVLTFFWIETCDDELDLFIYLFIFWKVLHTNPRFSASAVVKFENVEHAWVPRVNTNVFNFLSNDKILYCILKINENSIIVFFGIFPTWTSQSKFCFHHKNFTYSFKRLFFVLIDCQYALFKRTSSNTSYLTPCNVPHEWFVFMHRAL